MTESRFRHLVHARRGGKTYAMKLELEKQRQEGRMWQPIKTAPHGIKVIVYATTSFYGLPETMLARFWLRHTLEVYHGHEIEDWAEIADCGTAYMPADWYEENSLDDAPAVAVYPTHWMPLPGAPFEPNDARERK